MATLAETFVGNVLQENAATRDPNAGSGFAQGAAIAQKAEELQIQRQQLEQKSQEFQQTKMAKFAEAVEVGQKYTGKAQQNYYNKFLPQYKKSLGLDDMISDDAIAFNGADEDMIRRQAHLISLVNKGKVTMGEAVATYHDPQKMAALFPGDPNIMDSAPLEKSFTEELNKAEQHYTGVQGQMAAQGAKSGQNIINNTESLRKELTGNPITKRTLELQSSYDNIRSALGGKPSPAGDIAGIYNFMRMNDPGSTVREGEYATAQNAAGVPDQIRNLYNKLTAGERLNPNQRKDFLNQAEKLYGSQYEKQLLVNRDLEEVAKQTGINPKLIYAGVRFKAPPPKGSQDKTADIRGHKMNVQQLRSFKAKHPNDPALFEIDAALKSLGGE